MAPKSDDYEFGYTVVDEDGASLVLRSNSGKDSATKLEHAKKLKRPILIKLKEESFTKFAFDGYALTTQEALALGRELIRMVEHLEGDK